MKQPSPLPAERPASKDPARERVRVSIGTGIIMPHVDRHVRRTRVDAETTRSVESSVKVSMGVGASLPAIAAHIARSRKAAR